jgi:hypothetical protein
MEPDAPFYRRWSFLLAGVIGVAVVVALLGWRGFSAAETPPTTSTATPVTTQPPPSTATEPPPSNESTNKPDEILWEVRGSRESTVRSQAFKAPSAWRIEWAFDCSNFADHGGGNYKITGYGAFEQIQIEGFTIRDNGTNSYNRSGFGRLNVETVCERWTVRVLSG